MLHGQDAPQLSVLRPDPARTTERPDRARPAHPMAACYAIYKTLFQDGYPFSYDLQELGRYYVAYRRLMRHWSETLPEGFTSCNTRTW